MPYHFDDYLDPGYRFKVTGDGTGLKIRLQHRRKYMSFFWQTIYSDDIAAWRLRVEEMERMIVVTKSNLWRRHLAYREKEEALANYIQK